jgi:peptide/nickel transport system permease protein
LGRFVLKRLLHLIPVLLGISLLTFLVMHLAPGDFLSQMESNPLISSETIASMRERFGLDRPWPVQYVLWLKNIFLKLDFGESFSRHQPVFQVLAPAAANSLVLALAAAVVTWLVALPLGILAAVKQNTWVDRAASLVAVLGISVPEVFLALLVLFFAARTGWFPLGGMVSLDHDSLSWWGKAFDRLHHLILPALVLATVPLASRMRQMRASLLEVLRADYVTTARAKGLPESRVVMKHAVRNALNPLVTLFGYTLGGLLSGAFLVEVILSWPGLGRVTIDALLTRDLYLIMGSVLMASGVLVLGNLVADLLLLAVDPRLRSEGA